MVLVWESSYIELCQVLLDKLWIILHCVLPFTYPWERGVKKKNIQAIQIVHTYTHERWCYNFWWNQTSLFTDLPNHLAHALLLPHWEWPLSMPIHKCHWPFQDSLGLYLPRCLPTNTPGLFWIIIVQILYIFLAFVFHLECKQFWDHIIGKCLF